MSKHQKQQWREKLGQRTDGFQRLPRVFCVDGVDLSLQLEDLLGLDGDVCGLTLEYQYNIFKLTSSTMQLFTLSRFVYPLYWIRD